MKPLGVSLVAFAICVVVSTKAQAQVAYVVYDPVAVACCAPPVAVATYYAPAPAVLYRPAAVIRTRRRPMLRGTVARVRYVDAPPVYASAWWW
jgi:hypothetical protein